MVLDYKRRRILDINIDALTLKETLERVEEIIKRHTPMQHVVVNASKIVLMQENQKLKEIINSCELINADGMAVVWASRFLNQSLPERVTGVDLFLRLIELAAIKGYKVFLFGAKEDVVQQVSQRFIAQYPNIGIVGYRNGYFSDQENDEIIEQIATSGADMLFLGFSSPKKEFWLYQHLERLKVPFCMGVGGSFDIVAGVTKRAPLLLQRTGFEWLYRFIQEPKRMWRRYLIGNFKFVKLVIKYKVLATRKADQP